MNTRIHICNWALYCVVNTSALFFVLGVLSHAHSWRSTVLWEMWVQLYTFEALSLFLLQCSVKKKSGKKIHVKLFLMKITILQNKPKNLVKRETWVYIFANLSISSLEDNRFSYLLQYYSVCWISVVFVEVCEKINLTKIWSRKRGRVC